MDCCSYLVFLGWGLFFWRFVISDKHLKNSFLGSIKEEKLNVQMFSCFLVSLPSVQILGLAEPIVPKNLDVTEH